MKDIYGELNSEPATKDIYDEFNPEPVTFGGLQQRVEVIPDFPPGLSTAQLVCVECFTVIDTVTASDPARAERVLRRRQARPAQRLTHCERCAEHVAILDHIPIEEEAPTIASAYAEAHEEVLIQEGKRW